VKLQPDGKPRESVVITGGHGSAKTCIRKWYSGAAGSLTGMLLFLSAGGIPLSGQTSEVMAKQPGKDDRWTQIAVDSKTGWVYFVDLQGLDMREYSNNLKEVGIAQRVTYPPGKVHFNPYPAVADPKYEAALVSTDYRNTVQCSGQFIEVEKFVQLYANDERWESPMIPPFQKKPNFQIRSGEPEAAIQSRVCQEAQARHIRMAGRAPGEIVSAIQQVSPSLFSMYSRFSREHPEATGKVVVEFDVAENGQTTACRIASSEIDGQEFLDSICRKILSALKLSRSAVGPATYTQSFNFAMM
jgi:hypothetical protein